MATMALGGLAACGGKSEDKSTTNPQAAQIRAASRVAAGDFPAPGGRSLEQLAGTIKSGPTLGMASSVFTPGTNRVAFGLIGTDKRFLYGKTALYIARSPNDRAQGPYVAPADSLEVAPPFRSKTAAADTGDVQAIYEARLPLNRPGSWYLLAANSQPQGLVGAIGKINVQRSTPIPAVGERPPRISTDTVASAHGNLAAIDTRDPHDDMHKVDFKDVIGKRPVALLIATPQLCQSRVCGPVTDIATELEHTYGKQIAFIHQEVYIDNQVNKGLRPPLRRLGLQTEPWLFTFNREGKLSARLEGAFGVTAFRQALQAALG